VLEPARGSVLRRMSDAIRRWDLDSRRNINYRSFEPILRLVRSAHHTPQCQHWAVWALANLTRVDRESYFIHVMYMALYSSTLGSPKSWKISLILSKSLREKGPRLCFLMLTWLNKDCS